MIRSRHALTLIELLVAMGIAVLLAAVVFAIYAGALRMLDSQGRWRSTAYPSAAALDALSLDLSSAVVPWGITNSPFVLAPLPEGADGIKLHFFAAMPVSAASSNAAQVNPVLHEGAYAIREINYTLSASKAAGANGAPCPTSGLVRAWTAFRVSAASGVVSNVDVWESVRAIRLEVFDGTYWTNVWGQGTNIALPRSARMTLTVGDESAVRQITSEVLVPAGHRIAAPKNGISKTN